MTFRREGVPMGLPGFSEFEVWQTSEETIRSGPLLKGILLTALISGVLQCVLFPHTALLGASGIVFMLIMLASLSGFSGGIRHIFPPSAGR